MSEALISVSNLGKTRGERAILRNLDFVCQSGELSLVLGPNGAGKSTFLRILAGLANASAGEITRKEGLRMSYIGHATFLYPSLNAVDNLLFQAKINGLCIKEREIVEILKKAGLAAQAYEPVRVFSRGMAQRLNFCRALMTNPELLLLDEPFTGMDQQSQKSMRMELARLRDNGAGIILVSHAPEVDSAIADKVLSLSKGRLMEAPPC